MTAREAPRVAFSELIERGMILPGAKLVDAKKRHGALVRADGAIMLGDKVGSIHRIGAVAQGAEACNGWTFWHVETKNGLQADRRTARRNPLRHGGGLSFPPLNSNHRSSRPWSWADARRLLHKGSSYLVHAGYPVRRGLSIHHERFCNTGSSAVRFRG